MSKCVQFNRIRARVRLTAECWVCVVKVLSEIELHQKAKFLPGTRDRKVPNRTLQQQPMMIRKKGWPNRRNQKFPRTLQMRPMTSPNSVPCEKSSKRKSNMRNMMYCNDILEACMFTSFPVKINGRSVRGRSLFAYRVISFYIATLFCEFPVGQYSMSWRRYRICWCWFLPWKQNVSCYSWKTKFIMWIEGIKKPRGMAAPGLVGESR